MDLERVWDHLPAAEAVARAWRTPGPPETHGTWHPRAVDEVRHLLPLLARALDRLLAELVDELPAQAPELWADVPAPGGDLEDCRTCGHVRKRHRYGYHCMSNCECPRFAS
jgi:hypothetical protein